MRAIILLFVLAVLSLSCATSPKAGPAPEDGAPDFAVLPPDADFYLWADVKRAKPLLEAISFEGISGKDASQIMERTDTALAAFYSSENPRRFFLAGWGNYPNLRAGASMTFSRDWKKVKSETGNRYWHSGRYNLGIALGPQLAFASDADPFSPGAGINPAPEGFEEFRRPCVLSGWLNDPDTSLNRFITGLGIPIQIPAEDFFFGAVRTPSDNTSPDEAPPDEAPIDKALSGKNLEDDGSWELVFGIKTPSANQARSLLSLISVARLFMRGGAASVADTGAEALPMSPQEAAALFFANAPEQNGAFLTLRTGPIDAERIAMLFSMFAKP